VIGISKQVRNQLSSGDVDPFDWFNRFFGRRGDRTQGFGFPDIFGGFEGMRRQMEREFQDVLKDIQDKAPKDLVKEYETKEGDKVKEYGPFVYGYSMTVGPDGRPKVREFGNVRSPFSGKGLFTKPFISSEREPLTEVTTLDKDVKVVVEMPGVTKENIQIKSYDNSVEVSATGPRKYREVINLPEEADIETAKSVFNNGILEITFSKKDKSKPKGKDIKVD
jgi:HSP20 family protein